MQASDQDICLFTYLRNRTQNIHTTLVISNNANNLIKKQWAKDLTGISPKKIREQQMSIYKLLNIISHQKIANKTRVRCHYICTKMDKLKEKHKYQVLKRMQSNWKSHILLVGMQNGIATLTNSWAVSYKTKHAMPTQPSNYTRGHSSQRNENRVHTKTCT